jgi:ectoine hydroxylase-related dioxygenase (phytanoyl-CoA dioxygenase family)
MCFIPGSHKGGVLRHGFMDDDPAVTTLILEDKIDITKAVLQPVPIGGASIHHNRTLHGSGPNRTDNPRRAYVNEWQIVPVKREVPYDRPWYWERQKALRANNNKLEVADA